MKKFLTAFLFVSSLTLMGAAVGCKKSHKENSAEEAQRSVRFEDGEGYTFSSNASEEGTIAEGSLLTFAVDMGAFYAGNPIAYVNDEPVLADANGVFSYVVGEEDLVIRAEGVRKDVSNMMGSGAFDDAFVVSRPIDLLYIAEQVNKGNRTYATASYVLGNDIDCKGEELDIIGDYSTPDAYFSGVFSCVANSETGDMQRFTISNFTIRSQDSNYVGLFGVIFADPTVQSSGLLYGIRLDNFKIYAGVNEFSQSDANKSISCGGLLGYGVGANLTLCDATGGEINVVGDSNYFAYVGGLVGYQQGLYDSTYGMAYPADIVYATVDTDINVVGGLALYAGGISGVMTTNYPYGATASIHNSYSLGSVNGALRTGGIVGGMGQYTVVSNCYATGDIVAQASQHISEVKGDMSDEYCYAYAGGLVGYGENDSIVHDSFFIGSTAAFAPSGTSYALNEPFVGGGDAPGKVAVNGQKYLAKDCLYNDDIDLSNKNFFTQSVMAWQASDWSFIANELPTINYDISSMNIALKMTLNYVAPNSSDSIQLGQKSTTEYEFFNSTYQNSSYTPVGSWVDGNTGAPLLSQYYTADDEKNLSYGFFFDEACTVRIPLSYTPEKSFTVYVGFANPESILGTYYFENKTGSESLTLKLNADGTMQYSDGKSLTAGVFAYDGTYLLLEGVRLARYYDGAVVADEEDTYTFFDTEFELNRYNLTNFMGTYDATAEKWSLYDGQYFTKDAPLYASKTAPQPSNEFDQFMGSWTISANIHKTYTFDGKGKWTYTETDYNRTLTNDGIKIDKVIDNATKDSGTYEENGNVITFTTTNGHDIEATFHNGFLQITDNTANVTQIYHAEHSHVGVWRTNTYTLTLDGLMHSTGYGKATVVDNEGFTTKLVYEVSETDGILAFYYFDEPIINQEKTLRKTAFFGYAKYDEDSNTLQFVSPLSAPTNSTTGYNRDVLYLYDNFLGTWVTEVEGLEEVELTFNGLGLYEYIGLSGRITVQDGNSISHIVYTLNSESIGSFSYDGTTYRIEFDEVTGDVYIVNTSNVFKRQDEFGGITLVTNDADAIEFKLDGRSTLKNGGSFTHNGTKYTYFPTDNSDIYEVWDENGKSGSQVGSITHTEAHYVLILNGVGSFNLYITNNFMGDWAISGAYDLLHIGPTDTDGVIQASFKGTPVKMTFLDPATLQFRYRDANKVPHTYYVFVMEDETVKQKVLVVSDYTTLTTSDYLICTKLKADSHNNLYGAWWQKKADGTTNTGVYMQFDGVMSGYANGCAQIVLQLDYVSVVTDYFYMIRNIGGVDRMLMWSQEPLAGSTIYYRLDMYNSAAEAKAVHGETVQLYGLENSGKVLVRTEVDGLHLTQATDKSENIYLFDFDITTNKSTLYVNGVKKYTYEMVSYNDDNTATLHVTDIATGKTYEATLDYKDASNILFSMGSEVEVVEE